MSLSAADKKRYRSLQDKQGRKEHGLFLVQGRKVVTELLSSEFSCEAILASEEAASFVNDHARRRKVTVHVLEEAERDRIGTFERGNELIAIVRDPKIPAFRAPKAGEMMLALDGVKDPRNLGSLVRICDWFAIERLICSRDCMELYNPKVVQSTMGSLFRVELRQQVSLVEELTQAKAAGAHIYLADMDGRSAFEQPFRLPGILVMGSESHGHSKEVRALGAEVISIPRLGVAESLNVAMAASALCMELARQKLSPTQTK